MTRKKEKKNKHRSHVKKRKGKSSEKVSRVKEKKQNRNNMYNELSKIGILLRPEPYGQWCDHRRPQATPQAEISKPEDTT